MIQVFTHSEPGGHAHNEDAFEVRSFSPSAEGCLCVLADGQGGQAGGGEAARLACRVTAATAMRMELSALLMPATWLNILQIVDRAVADDPTAGYTTLVAFAVTDNLVCGASCGDSAAAAFQNNAAMNLLTLHQPKAPPVGSGFARFASFDMNLVRPWTVLAMSDGVWKYVGWERITKVVAEHRDERLIASLLEHARLRSGRLQDDFTIAAFVAHE